MNESNKSALQITNCYAENGSLHGVLEVRGPGMLTGNTSLGRDISPLEILVESIDSDILHLKIGAPGRWEVPKDDIFINTGTGIIPCQSLQQYFAAHFG